MTDPKKLERIERLCTAFDQSCITLDGMITELEADLEIVRSKHLRQLKRQATDVARLEAELRTSVEMAPDLFVKPRTLTIAGIKVGFTNSKGKLEWDDEDMVVAAILKHWKEDADVLLQTSQSPRKEALRALPAGDLAKLGCRIDGAGDQVVVNRQAGDVEKLITKLTEKLVAQMVKAE